MTRLASGWWIAPGVLLGAAGWSWIASFLIAAFGG